MFSKRSSLGSIILRTIQNDDVMPSSNSRAFLNNNQKWYPSEAKKKSFYWKRKITSSSRRFQKEIRTFSRQGQSWSKYSEFSHFTLLLCRGRWKNVPRFIAHVQSYCLAKKSFVWRRSCWRCCRGLLKTHIVHMGHYSTNGITVSLTWERNSYSGIFQNMFLFRNKVNRTHP